MDHLGYKVEFDKNISKIYDTDGKLIGKGDQNRSNLFYIDIEDATCLVVRFEMYGYGTRSYVMLILITWLVSIT